MTILIISHSIGRAIRHQNDWASLILIDSRYKGLHIQNKLPSWIKNSLISSLSFGQIIKSVAQFMKSK